MSRFTNQHTRTPWLDYIDGSGKQFVVMFLGSSSTQGLKAINDHINYVNQFSAMLTRHAMNSVSKRQVFSWQRYIVYPNSGWGETVETGANRAGTGWNFARTAVVDYTPGLFFFNGGISGRNSSSYFQTNEARVACNTLQPDLIVHMIGSNDYSEQVPLANYYNNLQNVVNDIRTLTGGKTKHLFVHSYERLDVNPAGKIRWREYGDKLAEFCAANRDCVFVNTQPLWEAIGMNGYPLAYPNTWILSDGVHCTSEGHSRMAEFVATASKLSLQPTHNRNIYAFIPGESGYANGADILTYTPATTYNCLEQKAITGTAGAVPKLITAQLNGQSIARFDGVNDQIGTTFNRSYGLPVTVVFAVNKLGDKVDNPIYSRMSSDMMGYVFGRARQSSTGTNITKLSTPSNGGDSTNPPAIYNDRPRIFGVVYNYGDIQQIYPHSLNPIDGSTLSVGGGLDVACGPFTSSLKLGANTAGTTFSVADLGDFYLIQGALTKTEINVRMQALATKYGLTLDTDYVPPGTSFQNPLDNINSFTRTQNGSGITANGSAQWGGGTDGQGLARYNSVSESNDQYAACLIGALNNAQYSGLVIQCPATPGSYYGLSFKQDTIQILRVTGRWRQTFTEIMKVNVALYSGDKIEFWNKGEDFYCYVNDLNVFPSDYYTVSGSAANMNSGTRYQGFGLMRASFNNSTPISHWWGGDAAKYGK